MNAVVFLDKLAWFDGADNVNQPTDGCDVAVDGKLLYRCSSAGWYPLPPQRFDVNKSAVGDQRHLTVEPRLDCAPADPRERRTSIVQGIKDQGALMPMYRDPRQFNLNVPIDSQRPAGRKVEVVASTSEVHQRCREWSMQPGHDIWEAEMPSYSRHSHRC